MFHVKQGGGGLQCSHWWGDVIVCVDSSVSGAGSHLLPSGGSGYGGGAATHTKAYRPADALLDRLHASLDLQRLDVVE